MALPEPNDFFGKFFLPHYRDGWMDRRMFPATFPDIVKIRQGLQPENICGLTPEALQHARSSIAGMFEAARGDWPPLFGVQGQPDLEWIKRFDEKCTAGYLESLISGSITSDFNNEALLLCCEFGVVLAEVLIGLRPELIWAYDIPYWDSWIYSEQHGMMINVFSWAMKKFSAYGVDDGYAAKINAVLNQVLV